MIRVSVTEFGKDVGRYQDAALTETVIVTSDGRDRTVLISAEEYRRLKKRDRRVIAVGEFTEEELKRIGAAEIQPGYEHLDDELKDWTP